MNFRPKTRVVDHTNHRVVMAAADVLAVLDGRKTVLRAPLRPQPPAYKPSANVHPTARTAPYLDAYCVGLKTERNPRGMSREWCWWAPDRRMGPGGIVCPFGVPGDTLWVQETWWQAGRWGQSHPEDDDWSVWHGSDRVFYAADGDPPNEPNDHWPEGLRNGSFSAAGAFGMLWRRRSATQMHAGASRLTLLVREIRVERLRDVTAEELAREGAAGDPREALRALRLGWDGSQKEAALRWARNPYAWRVEVERINKAKESR